MKFHKLVVADLGYGLHICPSDVEDSILPNVSVVQNSIVKFQTPSPELTPVQWDQAFR